jgi:hypothetical protein
LGVRALDDPNDEPRVALRDAGNGHVTSESDQHRAPNLVVYPRRGSIRGPSFGRGTEIEDRTRRDPYPAVLVYLHIEPGRAVAHSDGWTAAGRPEVSNVLVIPECDQGGTDHRVDETVGGIGNAQRGRQQVDEIGGDVDPTALGRVNPRDLVVGAESTHGIADSRGHVVDDRAGGPKFVRRGHDQDCVGGPQIPVLLRPRDRIGGQLTHTVRIHQKSAGAAAGAVVQAPQLLVPDPALTVGWTSLGPAVTVGWTSRGPASRRSRSPTFHRGSSS